MTPEAAAGKIIKGVERNRYWVYTSGDIQLAHLLQRWFEIGYILLTRLANDRFTRIAREAKNQPGPPRPAPRAR